MRIKDPRAILFFAAVLFLFGALFAINLCRTGLALIYLSGPVTPIEARVLNKISSSKLPNYLVCTYTENGKSCSAKLFYFCSVDQVAIGQKIEIEVSQTNRNFVMIAGPCAGVFGLVKRVFMNLLFFVAFLFGFVFSLRELPLGKLKQSLRNEKNPRHPK